MFTPFLMVGLTLIAVALTARALGRIPHHVTYGFLALSQVATGAGGFLTGNTTAASLSTAAAALLTWQWWNGGGGDDTKRRSRRRAYQFHGVRRTAPADG